jgi:ATP-dependent Lon protease
MDGISVDLSRAIFIFSFNDRNKVCPILLDRMEIIKFHSYSSKEKKYITEKYLLPSVVNQYFGNNNKITIKIKNKQQVLNKIIKFKNKTKYLKTCHKLLKHKHFFKGQLNFHNKRNRNLYGNGYGYDNGYNSKSNGGVRYIKRKLENIISRINIERLEQANTNNNTIIIDDRTISNICNNNSCN